MGSRIVFGGKRMNEEEKNKKYTDFYGVEAAQQMAKTRSDIKKYGRKQ